MKNQKKKRTDIGVDAKKPKTSCNDNTCPWHGHLKVRGRIFEALVVSDKASKTVVVERKFFNYVPKYERYERRKTSILAHNPTCVDAKIGDTVRIAECRPISKSKSFVVIESFGSGVRGHSKSEV
ncbi:MAG: 30S ribosomal protein S17 [Candidatus Aenigmatarchaeota archaeon]